MNKPIDSPDIRFVQHCAVLIWKLPRVAGSFQNNENCQFQQILQTCHSAAIVLKLWVQRGFWQEFRWGLAKRNRVSLPAARDRLQSEFCPARAPRSVFALCRGCCFYGGRLFCLFKKNHKPPLFSGLNCKKATNRRCLSTFWLDVSRELEYCNKLISCPPLRLLRRVGTAVGMNRSRIFY